MRSNKTKVCILIGVLVILLLPLMAGCVSIKEYYDCYTVIHEGKINHSQYVTSEVSTVTFSDGAAYTSGNIYSIDRNRNIMTIGNLDHGISYKLLSCAQHPKVLLLIPSSIKEEPTTFTPFNPQKDCDCEK